jgi:dihydroneopterin aldolase
MVDPKILAARFYAPHASPSAMVLDKIAVRGLVLDCHVGVFPEEKGVKQRVRFTVEVSLFPSPHALDDRLDYTVSYDDVVEAVKRVTEQGHINLLETMAERIAEACLADRRAAKARVLVEKLDRLQGASLSVEIERSQPAAFEANVYALPWTHAPGRDPGASGGGA